MSKNRVRVKPQNARGMRDFLPAEALQRAAILERIRAVFESYGYEPLETPAIERLDVLMGKTGEEGDQLMFKILRRGLELQMEPGAPLVVDDLGELSDLGLRYDLTVPLSRVVAQYANELALPFKRYQIQPVWRADKPQKGRYREFYQCDIDAVGSPSMAADAEILAIINDVLTTLGFTRFTIRLNNRKLLEAIAAVCGVPETLKESLNVALDKLDKIGVEGVLAELRERGIDQSAIDRLLPVLRLEGENDAVMARLAELIQGIPIGMDGLDELRRLFQLTLAMGIPTERLRLDLFLVRGLSYYTGPIFESVVEEPRIGSLTGGGRYDGLVGNFLGREIPATGSSLGIERIFDVMREFDMLPPIPTATDVLVTVFDEAARSASLEIARLLRGAAVNVETYIGPTKKGYRKQLGYANDKRIPLVVLAGPDELDAGTVTVKRMTAAPDRQEQLTVPRDRLIETVRNLLG